MEPNAAVTLALSALQAVLNLVGELKSQHGLSDEDILAHAKELTGANDAAYESLKAALTPGA